MVEYDDSPSVLVHRGLHLGNIIVDMEGEFCGVIDGESNVATPLQQGACTPKLLENVPTAIAYLDLTANMSSFLEIFAEKGKQQMGSTNK